MVGDLIAILHMPFFGLPGALTSYKDHNKQRLHTGRIVSGKITKHIFKKKITISVFLLKEIKSVRENNS